MSLPNIPSAENFLLDGGDTFEVEKSDVYGLKAQFEQTIERMWSTGAVTADQEEINGVIFSRWLREGNLMPVQTGKNPDDLENIAITWIDRGVYSSNIGERAMYMYREQENIFPLTPDGESQIVKDLLYTSVIETRNFIFERKVGEWAFRIMQMVYSSYGGSWDRIIDPNDPNVFEPTKYRARALSEKLAAFEAGD